MSGETTTITLHTEDGVALSDERVYETVKSAAESLAERYGIEVLDIEGDAESMTVTIGADEVIGVGFAAELRRTTNQWYESKYGGGPLWRSPPAY